MYIRRYRTHTNIASCYRGVEKINKPTPSVCMYAYISRIQLAQVFCLHRETEQIFVRRNFLNGYSYTVRVSREVLKVKSKGNFIRTLDPGETGRCLGIGSPKKK